jgi:hypothetical protein
MSRVGWMFLGEQTCFLQPTVHFTTEIVVIVHWYKCLSVSGNGVH